MSRELSPDISTYVVTGSLVSQTSLLAGVEAADSIYSIPIDWDAIPGTNVKIILSGYYTISNGIPTAFTTRVRIGGLGSGRLDPTGTVATSTVTLGQQEAAGASIAKPSGRSYLKVTYEADVNCDITDAKWTISIVPDDVSQGAILSEGETAQINSGMAETIGLQFLYNFSRFTDNPNISVSFTARNLNDPAAATVSYRVRIGGTWGGVDGSVAAVNSDLFNTGDGHVSGASGTIAKPSGWQPVKVTIESSNGQPAQVQGFSIIMKGVP